MELVHAWSQSPRDALVDRDPTGRCPMEIAGLRRQEVMGAVNVATGVVQFGFRAGRSTVAALLAAGAAAPEGPAQLTVDVALRQERL